MCLSNFHYTFFCFISHLIHDLSFSYFYAANFNEFGKPTNVRMVRLLDIDYQGVVGMISVVEFK